ncbi:MAG: response regulator transcription factor [Acidobacteriia bacterium]|nr:response regulator transcription factor [Terriglobia bacterium]
MDQFSRKDILPICVVAENRLACAYLLGILRKDAGLQPIVLEDLIAAGRTPPKLVAVVDRSGLRIPLCECLSRFRRSFPNARILVLDQDHVNEKEEVVRMLLLGAHGFLEHERSAELLAKALRFVAAGHYWVAPGVLELYLREVSDVLRNAHKRPETFTPRENQVLELVRSRLTNREIAGLLKIRISTVKFHLSNVLSKLNLTSRQDLVVPMRWDIWSKLLP